MITGSDSKAKYPGQVVSGLSGPNRYILLHRNNRKGVHLAFRPNIKRVSETLVVFGGLLRVGLNTFFLQEAPAKNQETDLTQHYRELNYGKGSGSDSRIRAEVGVAVVMGRYDLTRIQAEWKDLGVADAMLKAIEKVLDIDVLERRKVKAVLDAEIQALIAHNGGFYSQPNPAGRVKTPGFGKVSPLINFDHGQGSGQAIQEFTAKTAPKPKAVKAPLKKAAKKATVKKRVKKTK